MGAMRAYVSAKRLTLGLLRGDAAAASGLRFAKRKRNLLRPHYSTEARKF